MQQTSSTPARRSFMGIRSKSTKSTKSQLSASSHSRKESESKQIKSKADPNAALNESQPIAAQLEAPTITSLRSFTFTDRNGQPIAEPDLSNPSRSRWERPLDTVRGFQENIDRAWYERRSAHASSVAGGGPGSETGSALHSSSNSVRNSQYGGNGIPSRFSSVNEYSNHRVGGGHSSRGFPNHGGHSPGPGDHYHPDPHRRQYPGPDDGQGGRGGPGYYPPRPMNGQGPRGYPHPYPPGGPRMGSRGGPPGGYAEYPDPGQPGPSQGGGPDDMAAGRDWAFQNKFGAILAYADMDGSQAADGPLNGPGAGGAPAGGSNRYPPPPPHGQQPPPRNLMDRQGGDGMVPGYGREQHPSPQPQPHQGYPHQNAGPNGNGNAPTPVSSQGGAGTYDGYRTDDQDSDYHPGFDPRYPPFEARSPVGGINGAGALNPISNNVAPGYGGLQQQQSVTAGQRQSQMTPPMDNAKMQQPPGGVGSSNPYRRMAANGTGVSAAGAYGSMPSPVS